MAIIEAFKEAMGSKGLVEEINSCTSLVSVFCDIQSVIYLAKNQNTFHKRTKHISVKYHFTGDVIVNKELSFMKILPSRIPPRC